MIDLKKYIKDIYTFHNFVLPILNPELNSKKTVKVPKFHLDIYKNLFKKDRLQLIVAPVGFAKSTLLKIFLLYEIFFSKKDKYVLYVSSTDTKAVEHLAAIQKILKTPYFQVVFKYQIDTDNTHEIVIKYEKERYKIEAVASGADIAGKNFEGIRPSLIIVDDLEELDQARSTIRTNKLQDWLLTVLIARLPSLTEGRVRMINTVLSMDSLTNRILGKSPLFKDKSFFNDWKSFFYEALDKNNKSIWEDRHPTQKLLEEKSIRPHIFARNYMNSPLDENEALVKFEMLRFYDFVDLDNFEKIYLHADTTHTGKTTSDYFCLVAVGENKINKNYYILDFILKKLDVESQARQSIVFYQRFGYKVKNFTYDEKANQGFGFWIKKLAREEYNLSLPIAELKYTKDKITHFEPHLPHFISNRVFLPKKHKQIQEAITQLTSFPSPGVNDDFVDGVSGALDNYTKNDTITDFSIFT